MYDKFLMLLAVGMRHHLTVPLEEHFQIFDMVNPFQINVVSTLLTQFLYIKSEP